MSEFQTAIIVNVRFSETDAMGVVWHGNYLKFLEDAREAFGQKYGLEYLYMYESGYFTPIVKSELEYKAPVYYGQDISVLIRYLPSPAAKIIFEYEITNQATGSVCATGRTEQVFLNSNTRALELYKPAFFTEWENKNNINPKRS